MITKSELMKQKKLDYVLINEMVGNIDAIINQQLQYDWLDNKAVSITHHLKPNTAEEHEVIEIIKQFIEVSGFEYEIVDENTTISIKIKLKEGN